MKHNDHNSENGVMEQLEALGYIDPGRGSFFMQSFAAPFFRLTSLIKSVWTRMKSFFQSTFGGKEGA